MLGRSEPARHGRSVSNTETILFEFITVANLTMHEQSNLPVVDARSQTRRAILRGPSQFASFRAPCACGDRPRCRVAISARQLIGLGSPQADPDDAADYGRPRAGWF